MPLSTGTTLGSYEFLARFGEGEVYLARDTRLDRKVALKALHRYFRGRHVHYVPAVQSLAQRRTPRSRRSRSGRDLPSTWRTETRLCGLSPRATRANVLGRALWHGRRSLQHTEVDQLRGIRPASGTVMRFV